MKILCFRFSMLLSASLFFACADVTNTNYKLSTQESLNKVVSGKYLISDAEVAALRSNGTESLIVDIRSAALFETKHAEGAVNIPVAHLLDDDNFKKIRKAQTVVLTGETTSQANGPWLLLTQLGIRNVKILANETREPETAGYDFAAIFKQATERHAREVEAGKPKPVIRAAEKKSVTPVKKTEKKPAAAAEEGC